MTGWPPDEIFILYLVGIIALGGLIAFSGPGDGPGGRHT